MPRTTEKISMWFDYPDDPDKGRVEITNLDDRDIAEITDKCFLTRTVYDEESKLPRQEHVVKNLLDRQETAVRAVKNWERFYGTDGQETECTEANKRLWACNNDFMKFINEKRAIVAEAAEKLAEEKRKN